MFCTFIFVVLLVK